MGKKTFLNVLNKKIHTLFNQDSEIVILGEDILDPYGGAFKVTKGLSTQYPDRVLPMPISEAAIVGVGTGLAIKGLKVVIEIMFGDFVLLAADQIVNNLTKIGVMYNKKIPISIVIRLPMGGYRGYGPTHSQSLESFFLNVPNLGIISSNIFSDPGDLFKHTLDQKSPHLFVEHKINYPKSLIQNVFNDIEISNQQISSGFPINRISIAKDSENSEIIILTYGYMVELAVEAAIEIYLEEEINVNVFSITDIKNNDVKFLEKYIGCGKVIILEEGISNAGWGTFYSKNIAQNFFKKLKLPVKLIGSKDQTIPNARKLELDILPSVSEIVTSINEMIKQND